jgi:hypothetical protein
MPTNLPHPAPVNNRGIKIPEGTAKPNVHIVKRRYSIEKIKTGIGSNESKNDL